jgi:lipoprotein NlpI
MNTPFSLDTEARKITAFADNQLSKKGFDICHRRLNHISEKVVLTLAKNKSIDNFKLIQSQSNGWFYL